MPISGLPNITEIWQGTTNQATVATTSTDTTGLVVRIIVTPVDTSDDETTKVEVGSVAGDAAGVDLTINCDWTSLAIGRYYMEVIADDNAGGTPLVLIPNETNDFMPEYVEILDSYAISD